MQKRMLPLKALKPHVYGTRHLTAGEEYEAPLEEAIAHVALRRADFIRPVKRRESRPQEPEPAVAMPEPAVAASPPPSPPSETDHNIIDRLRDQATALGIEVDGRWGVVRLRYEIEQAK